MPACLPEQFMANGVGPPPARIAASRASSSSGQLGGVCRTEGSRPTDASTARTAAWWKSSPECEAQTTASCSAGSDKPTLAMPTACNGLLELRG